MVEAMAMTWAWPSKAGNFGCVGGLWWFSNPTKWLGLQDVQGTVSKENFLGFFRLEIHECFWGIEIGTSCE